LLSLDSDAVGAARFTDGTDGMMKTAIWPRRGVIGRFARYRSNVRPGS